MGRIVVAGMVSIDGYMTGAGGDLSAMPFDGSFSVHNADRIRTASSLLYGATTYREMLAYWPGVPDDPAASPADAEIGARMAHGLPITVVSDSLTPEDTGAWREQTTIVPRAEAHEAVRRLRERDGDTVIFGSISVWPDLLAHGLVDDLYLQIGSKVVAGDRNVFADVPPTALRLVEVLELPDTDSRVLHYETR